jgi:hypothetical protein
MHGRKFHLIVLIVHAVILVKGVAQGGGIISLTREAGQFGDQFLDEREKGWK